MKWTVGVLAVASLCLAKPEADPQLLLHPAPAVAHVPLVKSVVETPAEVTHEVHSLPLVHHVAPLVHAAPFVPAAPSPTHVAHEVKPFVHFRKKREADADPLILPAAAPLAAPLLAHPAVLPAAAPLAAPLLAHPA